MTTVSNLASDGSLIGANPVGGGTRFRVWAPGAASVEVAVAPPDEDWSLETIAVTAMERDHPSGAAADDADGDGQVREQRPLRAGVGGFWTATIPGVGHGRRYRFRLDGDDWLADPATRWQPRGVHGPSAVVDPATFVWDDERWRGLTLAGTVLYELHVGTFTPEGTFDGVVTQLERLAALGVTAIELMPVAAFPGERNWGYDGVFCSAVQDSYGGPGGLARLVDAAHRHGLGVVLDVVYNHLGPEGNVLGRYGPYFTDRYRTPWGDAVNVAGPHSDPVRRYFIESACRWVRDYHIDGLRLDAVHAIYDPTAVTFVEQIAEAVRDTARAAGREAIVIAESSDNDPRTVQPGAEGGIGCDAVWNDDLHHSLRVALTGERRGYYADYDGVGDLATALSRRWVFAGRYSAYRRRHHGRSAEGIDFERLVAFTTDHDHIGNTPDGRRPPYDGAAGRLAAATVLLGPFTPMLFMGEEYGETAPFPYFVDHTDPELIQAVRQGRRREFADAAWEGEVADPASLDTFQRAVLDTSVADRSPHREIAAMYTELLRLRRVLPALHGPSSVAQHGNAIVLTRGVGTNASTLVLNFGDEVVTVPIEPALACAAADGDRSPDGAADDTERGAVADVEVLFDGNDPRWGGPADGAAVVSLASHDAAVAVPGRTPLLLGVGGVTARAAGR